MPGARITLNGGAELKALLAALPGKVRKQILRRSLRAAAKVVQADAQRIAPEKSGALAKSIKIRAMKRSRTRIGMLVFTDGETLKAAGHKAFYGAFTELGTHREAPQPFLRPALHGNASEIQSMIAADIREACESKGGEA